MSSIDNTGEEIEILPTTESRGRGLRILEPIEQRNCWKKAVERAGGKVPSAKVVNNVLEEMKRRIRERSGQPFPYHAGTIVRIIAKGVPELRNAQNCRGYITEVRGHYSATVRC